MTNGSNNGWSCSLSYLRIACLYKYRTQSGIFCVTLMVPLEVLAWQAKYKAIATKAAIQWQIEVIHCHWTSDKGVCEVELNGLYGNIAT